MVEGGVIRPPRVLGALRDPRLDPTRKRLSWRGLRSKPGVHCARKALWSLGLTVLEPRSDVVDQNLLRSYFATVYELPTDAGLMRVSTDGEVVQDTTALPELLRQRFAVLTAYNPRSMLLPRRVNDGRHQVMRDLLILGCWRVEHCVGYDEEPEGVWREPAWLVHGIEREEAIHFGRVFRQNTIVYCSDARPQLIVTDPTCDEVGKSFQGNWRVRQ